jgi:hypothetical protein
MYGATLAAKIAYGLAILFFIGAVVAFFGLAHTPAGWITLLVLGIIAAVVGSVLDRRGPRTAHRL